MANGFLTETPAARHGVGTRGSAADKDWAQQFTSPGTGADTYTITEIGLWCSADAATTGVFLLAIYTDDAANNCPESMVANSESSELSQSDSDATWDADKRKSFTYVTQPTITGGTHYWICANTDDTNLNIDRNTTGGDSVNDNTAGYPAWSTSASWETHADTTEDWGIYAVYVAAGGGAKSAALRALRNSSGSGAFMPDTMNIKRRKYKSED